MTNEEKAIEIAKQNYREYLPINPGVSIDECEKSALEMAEWKDERFVSQAREWFQDNAWSFAHSVDGEPSYDAEMALKSFLKKMNLKD